MKRILFLAILLTAVFLTSCNFQDNQKAAGVSPVVSPSAPGSLTQESSSALSLTSPDFQPGGPIPIRFTCKGENLSPALQWTSLPAGTQSLALVMDDPDALGFIHWLLYNLPSSTNHLAEGLPKDDALPDGSLQGTNSFKKTGYDRPCPPSGTHHYSFKLYALDTMLELSSKADKDSLEKVLEGHILAQSELVGTFSRP